MGGPKPDGGRWQDTVTPSVLNRCLGRYAAENQGYAVGSVANNEDVYPRTKVANAFTRRGYEVTATHKGWINFVRGYDRRASVTNAYVNPFKPEVDDE